MFDFSNFYQAIAKQTINTWLETIPKILSEWNQQQKENMKQWQNALDRIPLLYPDHIDLKKQVSAKMTTPLSKGENQALIQTLKTLMPWRKGPYFLHGIHIDTEWRSDLKWQRLVPHITPLAGKMVLDVGCGSGYHMWRIVGEGAHFVVGIDPMPLFLCQFQAVNKLLGCPSGIHFLPLGIEQLPSVAAFDTVFSMGVLHHRRSPLDHLLQLKKQLVSGGELILETLILQDEEQQVLLPQARYAKMKNVYFIPSVKTLETWLQKCGFTHIRLIDKCKTTQEEQRSTAWMTNESLIDFLDPNDANKTIEGYPAPLRAIIIANKT